MIVVVEARGRSTPSYPTGHVETMLPLQIQSTRNPDYERIGGAEQVRLLVERFYALMDELPQARDVRGIHPADLGASRQKLFEFLSGWLGGPPLYAEKHGDPRLRARHLPFAIGDNVRDQWLLCMRAALDDVVTDDELRERLYANMKNIADHIRNA